MRSFSTRPALAISALLLFTLFILPIQRATAITLDTFGVSQQVSSPGGSGITNRSVASTDGGIGGTRTIDTTSTSGPNNLSVVASTLAGPPPLFDHNQTGTTTGITNISWDGNLDANTVDFDGLGGIDLTEDLGDSFKLGVFFFDFPSGNSVTIFVRAYDASDPTGNTYSEWEIVLNRAYDQEDILVPFASPTTTGSGGAADITNLGALVLTISGNNPGVDLLISGFGTNGNCPLVPGVGGKVLDDCGECIPPTDPSYNQSCVDCLGVPNGTTLPGDSCDTGELGPCAPGIYNTACDCERITDPTLETCDGADNNCNGEIDETFPQLGGTCGISQDRCEVTGVFICDDVGGVTCDIDFSTAILDDCDIDIGCDGIPGSGTIPDECGICGGDGTSCEDFECNSTDISELLFQLDGGAKEQEQIIRRITRSIRKNTRGKRRRATINQYIKDVRIEAHDLQIANWILSWTLPRISVECSSILASNFCVFDDNTTIINEYVGRSEELRDLGFETAKRFRRISRRPKVARRWRGRVNNQHEVNLGIAGQVPETQAVCTAFSDDNE